jgi:hypothetical protein
VPVAGPAFFKTWLQYRGREKYDPRGLREAAQAASDEDACLFKPVIAHCLLFASGSDWSQWARDALSLMLSSSNPLIWQWIKKGIVVLWMTTSSRNFSTQPWPKL